MTSVGQSHPQAAAKTAETAEKIRRRRRPLSLLRQQQIWGWIFLSPWIFGFFAFTLLPIAASLLFSFTDYTVLRPAEMQWVGLANYRQLFTDPRIPPALGATVKFALIALPLSIILPIAVASLVNSEWLAGKRFFRTLFYMPYMVPVVSSVYIWRGVLNSETGWLNRVLGLVGIVGPNWLNDIGWIYPALNIIGIWGVGNAMLYTLAGMQTVPTELYEAARVDGAGPFMRFRKITFPMISPVVFYNLVLSVIGLWRYFETPYILSNGGTGQPGDSTYFINIHLYKTAFTFQQMGYGAAITWMLFALAFGSTLILFATRRYWVFYASED